MQETQMVGTKDEEIFYPYFHECLSQYQKAHCFDTQKAFVTWKVAAEAAKKRDSSVIIRLILGHSHLSAAAPHASTLKSALSAAASKYPIG